MSANVDHFDIETDVLVVGAGPAGLALAAFLGHYGVKGVFITKMPHTVRTPRAHYTNPGSVECLRDIGLGQAFLRAGTLERAIGGNHRINDTFTGREYVREKGFSNDPKRQGDYWQASPCDYVDVPQTDSEPLLLRHALHCGWQQRFNTELVSFEEDEPQGLVATVVRDTTTGHEIRIKSKYLAGADGARSTVAARLKLPFVNRNEGPGALAINVHYRADLSAYVKGREGLLHVSLLHSEERLPYGALAIQRVIQPWNEWLGILLAAPGMEKTDATQEQIVARVKQVIGFDPPDFELLSISMWKVNEEYASGDLSKGRTFCLGDAIHRHPPHCGFGSNTCIQDAYNLAWKLAYVLQGRAAPSLLDTYSPERQPVAKQIVTHANDALRCQLTTYKLMGALEPTKAEANAVLDKLLHGTTPADRANRAALRANRADSAMEQSCLGSEFNQFYSSSAVSTLDVTGAAPAPANPKLDHVPSTYPGCRLPHAWVSTDRAKEVSTHDLAGHGKFTLFTGLGGKDKWTAAAAAVMRELRACTGGPEVAIAVHSIGFGQDYEDMYYMWYDKCGVQESGAVLARPDRFVGWRCESADDTDAAELADKLGRVMRGILGFEKSATK